MSVVLTPLALYFRNWGVMWVAAVGSFIFSIAGSFTLGGLTILLSCLQVAAAVAMRLNADRHQWSKYLLFGALVWIVAVPVQFATAILMGQVIIKWFYLFPILAVFGLLLPLVVPAFIESEQP